jgi:hypothetical protein
MDMLQRIYLKTKRAERFFNVERHGLEKNAKRNLSRLAHKGTRRRDHRQGVSALSRPWW